MKAEVSKITYAPRCITDLNYDSFDTYHSCVNFNSCSVVIVLNCIIIYLRLSSAGHYSILETYRIIHNIIV